jgi:hypothetical protein
MGMYTEFHYNTELKRSTPEEKFAKVLQALVTELYKVYGMSGITSYQSLRVAYFSAESLLSEHDRNARNKPIKQDFLAKYGNELVCITSWLAEPRFTVNELVAAIEAKIRSNK